MSDLFQDLVEEQPRQQAVAAAWVRRAVLALFLAVVVAVLLGATGQQPSRSAVTGPAATMRLSVPTVVRGGLYFQMRIEVDARRRIAQPTIVLDHGWLEGLQVSSIEPQPANQSSVQGRVALSYDKLMPGDRLVVWLQYQVDPTNPGHHAADVRLLDGSTPLARISRTLRILP